jgi:serpin B
MEENAPLDTVKKITAAPIQIKLTENEKVMTKNNTDFAMRFFSTVNKNSKGIENVVVSPFSMSMALAVLRNGATGKTKEVINKTIGMKDFPDSEINAYFRKLKDSLTATDATLSLAIANSIWYKQNAFNIKKDFENLSNTWFDAPVTGLDYNFMNEAVATINKWCSDNTNGLIADFFNENANLSDFEILNALYFKGDWSPDYKFDASKTVKQDFTKLDGSKVQVDMMRNKLALKYYKDDILSLTSLPYGNKAYNIYFVLPAENITFDAMTKQLLVSGYWSQCVNRAQSRPVEIYIPKFTLKYRNEELVKVLSQLGMGVAFSLDAQFRNIVERDTFIIERTIQETYIKVNEKGTEAAAVVTSIIAIGDTYEPPPPVVFRADRPFLFVIQENSTGTILFMGKVGNPETK